MEFPGTQLDHEIGSRISCTLWTARLILPGRRIDHPCARRRRSHDRTLTLEQATDLSAKADRREDKALREVQRLATLVGQLSEADGTDGFRNEVRAF